jgi:hypothetical protein
MSTPYLALVATALVWCLPHSRSNPAVLESSTPSCLRASASFRPLEDDPTGPRPPLCHLVSPASVLNCANSSSTCVTAITPNYVCKLRPGSGCACVP